MKKKRFDCIAMKREGARRVYEAVGGMTVQEEVEFWRQQTLKFRREIRERKKHKTSETVPGE